MGWRIEMPEVVCGEYLVEYLFQFGPTLAAGMGLGPVTFQEMRAWQDMAGIKLQPWEAALLRRLSGEYADEAHKAVKRDRPPPFSDSLTIQRLEQIEIEKSIDAFLD